MSLDKHEDKSLKLASKPIYAHEIARALHKRHEKQGDFFITECKSGPTTMAHKGELLIFDAIAVKKSWTQPCVTIYEIKINRQDFLGDEKWPRYKEFCNRFYFVCPKGLILPDELGNGSGLITYNPENKSIYTAKKAPYMDNPLPTNVFYYILMNRLETERHPFFSKTREYFESLVADKDERWIFGNIVKSKLLMKLNKAEDDLRKAQEEMATYKHAYEDNLAIRKIMSESGYKASGYFLENAIKELLISQKELSNPVKEKINQIGYEVDTLRELIK